jgi:hypothetical protein
VTGPAADPRNSLALGSLMRRTLAALPLLLAALPAAAQTLPDGLYDCWIGSMNLGQIEVAGSQHRGPAFDGAFEGPSHPVTMDGPAITWGGPLGGISLAGTIVSTVAKGEADGTFTGFDVTIQTEDGDFQTVSCTAPG